MARDNRDRFLAVLLLAAVALALVLAVRVRGTEPGGEQGRPLHSEEQSERAAAEELNREPTGSGRALQTSGAENQRTVPSDVATCRLLGTVRDGAGAPVSGFHVDLYDSVGKFDRAKVVDGDYFASELQPGDWWISGYAVGWRNVVVKVDGLRPGEERKIDLSAQRPLVLAIAAMTDGGRPLRLPAPKGLTSAQELTELVPVATREPCGSDFPWRAGDSRDHQGVGRFVPRSSELDGAEIIGHLSLDVDPPVFVALTCYQGVLASSLVSPGQERVTFFVSGVELERRLAVLRFRVEGGAVGSGGYPELTLHGPGVFDVPFSKTMEQAELRGLPPGEYALVSPDRGLYQSFVLAAGDTLDLGSIVPSGPHEVRAMCRFPDGSLVSEGEARPALINFAIHTGLNGAHLDDSFQLQCDDGSDLIARLVPGSYTLQWRTEKYSSALFSVDLAGGSTIVDLVALEPAPLSIVPPARDAELGLRIFDSNAVELERVLYASPWPLRIDLRPGRLTVQATSVTGAPRSTQSVDLEAAGARLVLSP